MPSPVVVVCVSQDGLEPTVNFFLLPMKVKSQTKTGDSPLSAQELALAHSLSSPSCPLHWWYLMNSPAELIFLSEWGEQLQI